MTKKGDTWNESVTYSDPFSRRTVRRVTQGGSYNFQPAYHTLTGWSADGETFIFKSGRKNRSTIFRGDVRTGEITQLLDWQEGWGLDAGQAPTNVPTGIGGICLHKDSGWVYYVHYYADRCTLEAVNVDTLEERFLIEGPAGYRLGQPTVSGDGAWVAMPNNIIPPQFAGIDPYQALSTREIQAIYASEGGSRMQLVRVPTTGEPELEVVYDETDCRGNHVQYSPVDSNILHTDRDFAPRFWSGSDGERNRVWLYYIDEQKLVEQPSPSGRTFQVHSTWTFDGQEVLYHCPGTGHDDPGYVVGVNDLEGNTIAEYGSDAWVHYGHVGAVAGEKAVMLDGNLTDDLILWLYYDNPDQPRIEVICQHNTNWGGHEGQYSHPHPQCSPTGAHILFNAAEKGHSDVFVVEV